MSATYLSHIALVLIVCSQMSAMASSYYVAKTGADTNPGTLIAPFLTVQKGVNSAYAGDTVYVGAGTYTENVTSARSGTSGSRITIDGQGVATLWSFLTSHQYVSVINTRFAGRATSWSFYLTLGAHYTVISNNVFDGAYNTNMGRFVDFQNINPADVPFGGSSPAASGCTVISNLMQRGSQATYIFVHGKTNVIHGNTLINGDNVDWFNVWGVSNVISGNVCSNLFVSGLDPDNHPDLFQSFGTINAYGNVGTVLKDNYFFKGDGDTQICMIESENTPSTNFSDFTFRNNVFHGISAKGTMVAHGVKWYNNTFTRCSTNPLTAGSVLIYTQTGSKWTGRTNDNVGHGGQVFNNIFLDCGGTNLDRGWYSFEEGITNISADYNYVGKNNFAAVNQNPAEESIGDPGGWDIWTWWEDNGINGGNPWLYRAEIGDGRLAVLSPLIDQGFDFSAVFTNDVMGNTRGSTWDIGAHEYSSPESLYIEVLSKAPRAFTLVNKATPSITVVWPTNDIRTNITVSKRIYTNAPSAWTAFTSLHTNNTTPTAAGYFTDTAVTNGLHYEYLVKFFATNWVNSGTTNNYPFITYQYINTGIDVPLDDDLGRVILLVDTNLATSIPSQITTLISDLRGAGYKVYDHYVQPVDVGVAGWTNAVWSTRQLVLSDYNTATSAEWYVFAIGHVPVPYAGLSSPGSHTENLGAHPADWFYADMTTASWTDSTVNDTSSTDYAFQDNVPGDGKFDQSYVPSMPELRVGRVDMQNMPAFGKTQTQLVSQYLTRNHGWRHKQWTTRDMGLVITNGRPFEAHGRISSMFGGNDVTDHYQWLSRATNAANNYRFAFSDSSGSYLKDNDLGHTTNFAAVNLYAAFVTMFGSYYGDWDSGVVTNAVLQATLATDGYVLSTYYHNNVFNNDAISMGLPLGQEMFEQASVTHVVDTAKRYAGYERIYDGVNYPQYFQLQNFSSLLGDPTLKVAGIVEPPSNLTATVDGVDVDLSWTAPRYDYSASFHVYRASSSDLNTWTRLTSSPVSATSYTDSGAASADYTYMVRSVVVNDTAFRSYYEASQGVFAENEGGSEPATQRGRMNGVGRIGKGKL